APALGVVKGESVLPLPAGVAAGMIDLITRWDALKSTVENLDGETLNLADVRLLAPVPRPGKIMAIGLNYADHVAETGREPPKQQTWFSKMQSAVNGPFDPIQLPKASSMVDWEAELVFVVGRR